MHDSSTARPLRRWPFAQAPAIIDCTDPGVKVLARLSPETLAGCPPRANKVTGEIPGECIVACEQDGNVRPHLFPSFLSFIMKWLSPSRRGKGGEKSRRSAVGG